MQLKDRFKYSTFVIIFNLLSDILINTRENNRMLEFSGIILQNAAFLIIDVNFKRNKYIMCDNVEYKHVIILILLQHVIKDLKKIMMRSLEFYLYLSCCFLPSNVNEQLIDYL